MNNKIMKLTYVFIVILMIPVFSFAMPKMSMMGDSFMPMQIGAIDQLNLPKAKLAEIKKIILDHQTFQNEQIAQMKNQHLRLMDELSKDSPNKTKISEYTTAINKIRSGMLDNQINQILKFKELLTPEQFQKIKEIRKHHMAKRQCKMQGDNKANPKMKRQSK